MEYGRKERRRKKGKKEGWKEGRKERYFGKDFAFCLYFCSYCCSKKVSYQKLCDLKQYIFFSYSSGDQKSEMASTGLKLNCWQNCDGGGFFCFFFFPTGSRGESVSLPFPCSSLPSFSNPQRMD